MPEIEIADEQAAFLEDLGAELAEDHAGEYAHVRPQDALQFLIDHFEASDGSIGGATDEATPADSTDPTTDGSGTSGPDRLEAMMNLLDEHDEQWEQTDSDGGKYVVSLPDGDTEQVRTKDDVRALLFKHYG